MATYDAGIVTAYGAAVRGGYTGTYEEFCRQQAEYAASAAAVEQAKEDVQELVDNIPEDYTQLSEDVNTLKEDFGDLSELETENKSSLVGAINEAATMGGGGAPIPITLASKMTDTESNYLYLGSEVGYDYGYVYVYLNDAWTKSTLYGKGQDGYSPSISVSQTTTGTTISVTDKSGTTTAFVENGTATDAQVAEWLDSHPEATTTVQDGSITEPKLSDGLKTILGIETPKTDRSVNISNYATTKLARWQNGNPSYQNTPDCIEFAFDMTSIRPIIPEGLSYGINIMRFGVSDETTYGCRYIIYHNSVKTVIGVYDTTSSLSGKYIIPDYSDLDSVYIYVFLKSGATPTSDDISPAKNKLVAETHDMLYGRGVDCNYLVSQSYERTKIDITLFGYENDTAIKTIAHIDASTSPNTVDHYIGVFSSEMVELGRIDRPSLTNLFQKNNAYVWMTGHYDAPTVTWDDITFMIPNGGNVGFWYIYTNAISSNLVVINNDSEKRQYSLSDEDRIFLESLYPDLKTYKGVFNRNLNNGSTIAFNPDNNPPVVKANISYHDILSNGEDGDWYIHGGYNDLNIRNSKASYGDIIYRKSPSVYLTIPNPIKWGNYQTVGQSSYDIVIVGGGAGGIGAAYSLIDSGLKVLLVDKMQDLGGTHTQAGLVSFISSPIGDWFKSLCKDGYDCSAVRFTSFSSAFSSLSTFDELWDAALATNPATKATLLTTFNPDWLSRRYHEDITSGGIEIRYQRKFISHNDVGGKISSLVFKNLVTGGEEKVFAKCVIDCTGDVYVGRYNRTLDTDYFIGTDPYSMYHESAADAISEGSHYDINTCEIMYRYGTHNSGDTTNDYIPFTNSDDYADHDVDFKSIDGVINNINSIFSENYYADPNGMSNNPFVNGSYFPVYSRIVSPDYYCGLTKQMFVDNGEEKLHEIARDYAKAHYLIRYKTTSTYFMGEFPLLAIREGYRMKCEYMVTQSDIEDTITSSNYESKNIVALSSWFADIHQNTVVKTNTINNTFKNGIPYLAMVPTSYKNLLIACRGYGSSHIGLSGIRLIKTMMSLGRAAGFAAKQYVEENLMDMRNVDVEQLQTDLGIGTLLTYLEENVYPNYE